MPSYTDVEEVRRVLAPEVTASGSGESAAELSDEDINNSIERISARINTFLARQYRLPLPEPVPDVLRDIATDIVAYDITLSFYGSVDISDDDPVIRRYRDARGMLGQLSTGLLVLDLPTDEITDDPVVINPPGFPESLPGLHYRFVRALPSDLYPGGHP